jgi:hypothetical protein
MGGWGSSRWDGQRTRATTGECVRLDLARIDLRDKTTTFMSAMSQSYGPIGVRISPDLTQELVRVTADIQGLSRSFAAKITVTHPRYGGCRRWFRCPFCGHRRRVLYLTLGLVLGCQGCLRLAYPTQRMTRYWRLDRRLDSIWRELGGTEETQGSTYWPRRPKWRRRATQERLRAQWSATNAAMGMQINADLARFVSKFE